MVSKRMDWIEKRAELEVYAGFSEALRLGNKAVDSKTGIATQAFEAEQWTAGVSIMLTGLLLTR